MLLYLKEKLINYSHKQAFHDDAKFDLCTGADTCDVKYKMQPAKTLLNS